MCMNSKQIKMMFLLLTLISALILQPSEVQSYDKCLSLTKNVKGCFQVLNNGHEIFTKISPRNVAMYR